MMKKILIFLVILFLSSCSNRIERQISKFADDIIENPEQIENLRQYHSALINENFLTKEMLDSNYLKTLKIELGKNFKRNSSGFHLYKVDDFSVKEFCKENGIKDCNFILGYVYLKKALGIDMYIYVNDDNLYLVRFGSTFIRTELEKIYDDQ